MRKRAKGLKPKVFFNASVILAGLKSPEGGSAKILSWAREGKIVGFVNEIVLDETKRHLQKLGLKNSQLERIKNHLKILPAPEKLPEKHLEKVLDIGDVHLFASAHKTRADYLVSLDQKHVLSLKKKIKDFKILSPGDLLKALFCL